MENEELFQNNKNATCKYKLTVAVWQTFSLCFLNVFFQKFKFKGTSLRPPKSYVISIFLINNSTAGFPIKKSGKVLKIIVYWKRNLIEIFPTLNFFFGQKEGIGWFRSSCLEVFCKKRVLKNFPKFMGKYLRWSLFLIKKLRYKRDSNTGVFLRI